MAIKYIRNDGGGVHSVTDDHLFLNVLEDSSGRVGEAARGTTYLPRGWEYITEAEARVANPQLFGAPDPHIHMSAEELKREIEHNKLMKELYGDQAQA